MEIFVRGILFGLVLAVLLGPIFIVIINLSIQQGKRAGFIASSGVWLSDLIFISLSYYFMSKVSSVIDNDSFRFWLGILGGIILIGIGITNLFKKVHYDVGAFAQKLKAQKIASYFTKGFLVNTINPFTFFFWLTVMTSEVVGKSLLLNQSFLFLSGIFLTIVLTDSIKVILADEIRKRLNPSIFSIFIKVAGLGLIGFGIYFIYYAFSH